MKKPPGLIRRCRNLAKAVVNVGSAVLHGDNAFCSTFDAEQRVLICEACDLYKESTRVCTHQDCGCFIEAKSKIRTEHCPMSLWPGDVLL